MNRRSALAMAHIGAKQLGLISDSGDRDDYEAMLASVTNRPVSSAALLTPAELEQVIRHLRACGARFGSRKPKYPRGSQAALIRHLWTCLNRGGAVRDGSDRALRSFVKSQSSRYHPDGTGYDAPNLLPTDVAAKIIEHLKRWCEREHIETS